MSNTKNGTFGRNGGHQPRNDHERRRQAAIKRLESAWEHIYEKYGRDVDGEEGDIIDLETGRLVVDNGHLRGMKRKAGVWRSRSPKTRRKKAKDYELHEPFLDDDSDDDFDLNNEYKEDEDVDMKDVQEYFQDTRPSSNIDTKLIAGAEILDDSKGQIIKTPEQRWKPRSTLEFEENEEDIIKAVVGKVKNAQLVEDGDELVAETDDEFADEDELIDEFTSSSSSSGLIHKGHRANEEFSNIDVDDFVTGLHSESGLGDKVKLPYSDASYAVYTEDEGILFEELESENEVLIAANLKNMRSKLRRNAGSLFKDDFDLDSYLLPPADPVWSEETLNEEEEKEKEFLLFFKQENTSTLRGKFYYVDKAYNVQGY